MKTLLLFPLPRASVPHQDMQKQTAGGKGARSTSTRNTHPATLTPHPSSLPDSCPKRSPSRPLLRVGTLKPTPYTLQPKPYAAHPTARTSGCRMRRRVQTRRELLSSARSGRSWARPFEPSTPRYPAPSNYRTIYHQLSRHLFLIIALYITNYRANCF